MRGNFRDRRREGGDRRREGGDRKHGRPNSNKKRKKFGRR